MCLVTAPNSSEFCFQAHKCAEIKQRFLGGFRNVTSLFYVSSLIICDSLDLQTEIKLAVIS